ncbi:AI-2E family transporter [soil metagenome]
MTEPSSREGRRVYTVAISLLALSLGVYFIYPIRVGMLVLLSTMLLAIVLGAPVDYLARKGLSRVWATLAVILALFAIIPVSIRIVAPIIVNQVRQLVDDLPGIVDEVSNLIEEAQDALGLDAVGVGLNPEQLPETVLGYLSSISLTTVANVGSSAATVISLTIVVLLVGIYSVMQPDPLVNGFVSMFPAERRERVREILQKVYSTVQHWLLGQLVDMAILGALSAAALALIGIPFPILLGLITAAMSFVPYVGAVASVVPPVLLALTLNPLDAVWVVLAYVIIQQVESDLIYPLVMSRAVELHPAVVIFAIFLMGLLFGVLGFVLAVPLVAALNVLVHELWVARMDDIGDDPHPPPEHERKHKRGTGLFRKAAGAARKAFRRS